MRLTKATIKAAEPGETRYWLWDDGVPGLGIIVLPSGVKSWILRYRTQDGKQRTHTIGRCLEIHPDMARQVALEILATARQGADPTLARRMRRNVPTIDALAEEFERLHYPLCKPSTVANYKGYWKNHILSRFGGRRLDAITETDVREMRGDYIAHPILFNRVREMMAVAFDLAIERGWVETNPARNRKLKDFKERRRKRFLSEAEAQRLGRALEEYGQQSDIRWRFTCFITLLLITGCRANEIAKARWEWVDWERKKINWPDTKTGEDEGVLPDIAMDLLAELRRRNPGNPWIIAGARIGQPLVGYGKLWRETLALADINDLRVHDLRKSFASFALAGGFSLGVIAMLLRHANANVTAERYSFLMEKPQRDAANQTANSIVSSLRRL